MDEEVKNPISIQGECLGIDFSKRGDWTGEKDDNQAIIHLYIEDDEQWTKACSLDSSWIDDFIEVLQRTKEKLNDDFTKNQNGFGYSYRK